MKEKITSRKYVTKKKSQVIIIILIVIQMLTKKKQLYEKLNLFNNIKELMKSYI